MNNLVACHERKARLGASRRRNIEKLRRLAQVRRVPCRIDPIKSLFSLDTVELKSVNSAAHRPEIMRCAYDKLFKIDNFLPHLFAVQKPAPIEGPRVVLETISTNLVLPRPILFPSLSSLLRTTKFHGALMYFFLYSKIAMC